MTDRTPDFDNLLAVLRREKPARPTLFEFFLHKDLYERLAGRPQPAGDDLKEHALFMADAFAAAGYDYATIHPTAMRFPSPGTDQKASKSLDGAISIRTRADFDAYPWPDPAGFSCEYLAGMEHELPGGMKLIAHGPGGVLENVIELAGYEGLCYMSVDDPDLMRDIFNAVGSRLLQYYEQCVPYAAVGACIVNDDWGFKTQTMLRTEDMQELVIPWHTKIVDVIHAAGKPAILHSCGQLEHVMDDVIDTIGFDGKHSYEDAICPVEEMYDRYHDRIAIMGGIDLDFVCRRTPAEIRARVTAMLDKTDGGTGWGVGSGNSIPHYVPDENYFAMIDAVKEYGMVGV